GGTGDRRPAGGDAAGGDAPAEPGVGWGLGARRSPGAERPEAELYGGGERPWSSRAIPAKMYGTHFSGRLMSLIQRRLLNSLYVSLFLSVACLGYAEVGQKLPET